MRLEKQLAIWEELQQQVSAIQAEQGRDGHAVLQKLKSVQVRPYLSLGFSQLVLNSADSMRWKPKLTRGRC